MAITAGKLQTQSSAHALVIRPDTAPAKYLPRLLIYAVIALATRGDWKSFSLSCRPGIMMIVVRVRSTWGVASSSVFMSFLRDGFTNAGVTY